MGGGGVSCVNRGWGKRFSHPLTARAQVTWVIHQDNPLKDLPKSILIKEVYFEICRPIKVFSVKVWKGKRLMFLRVLGVMMRVPNIRVMIPLKKNAFLLNVVKQYCLSNFLLF